MTKIYNANTFLEADQIIATLQSQHISAEKREISDMNVITGKMETAFEIYVSEENAVKCIEQMSISDTDTSGIVSYTHLIPAAGYLSRDT